MKLTRTRVLGGVFVGLTVVTAVVLWHVLATVFFALTVVYVFTPVYRRLVDHGLPPWWASLATTILVLVGTLALLLPPAVIVYYRRYELVQALRALPQSVTLTVGGYTVTLTTAQLLAMTRGALQSAGLAVARVAPSLAVKFGLFVLVVFGLFLGLGRARNVVEALTPDEHQDVVEAFVERAHDTLWAIYVLQGVTAIGTFLVAAPVFFLLGYRYPIAMAVICGILQFLPIIGPSLFIALVAAYHVATGDVSQAALVVLVAGVLVAWLPDPIIRPRFARRTAHLPGTLYFVGFTGGVLSLGPVGIIAGPLIVALFLESVELLTDELRTDPGEIEEGDVFGRE